MVTNGCISSSLFVCLVVYAQAEEVRWWSLGVAVLQERQDCSMQSNATGEKVLFSFFLVLSSNFLVMNTAISHIMACSPLHETPGLRVLKAAHGHIFLLLSK